MGKYSLDAFEVYPLVKLRPAMRSPEADCYRLVELYQSELEPETGELLSPPPVGVGPVILRLHPDDKKDVLDVCGFIRRMGYCYAGGINLAGVVLTEGDFSDTQRNQLVQAYSQAFEETFLLVQPGTELVEVCRRLGIRFGLWLDMARGILNLRRSIAQENLARNWEKYPVYLWADGDLTGEQLDAARRWHTSGANVNAVLGHRMTLRRMMFPRDLTAGGPMPLRIWWQNLGTAPCYRELEICLELRREGERYHVVLPEKTMRPGLGDTTFNTTGLLPGVQGELELWIVLRDRDGLLPLSMEGREAEGMYEIGRITLDDVARPHLETMWEENYADGYYPLEDPAQPE